MKSHDFTFRLIVSICLGQIFKFLSTLQALQECIHCLNESISFIHVGDTRHAPLSFLTFPSPGTTSTTSIPRDYACGTNNVYVLVVPVRRYGAFQEVLSWRVEPNYSYGPLERLIACQYPITLIKGWVGAAALSKEQGCALTLLTCLFLDRNG